jgi:uncharacterized delta-60 repeat protein
VVTVDIATREDAAAALAIQADGRIVAAGGASVTAFDGAFALVRFDPDGTRDATFGEAGVVITNLSPGDDGAADIAIQADQRIVVAGTANGRFAVARYGPDGVPDPSFGGDGSVRTDVADGYDNAAGVAIDAGGNIVVAGSGGDGSFAVVRYEPDGDPDPTFGGGDGVVSTDLTEGYDSANAVAIDAEGNLVVAGEAGFCCEYTGRFGIVRYEPDGDPDPTFGGDGTVITNLTPTDDAAGDVAIQPNGGIVVAGTEGFDGLRSRFALARYTDIGLLDATFGGDGRIATSFSVGSDAARAIAIGPDGAIVAAGGSYPDPNGLNGRFALARYHG